MVAAGAHRLSQSAIEASKGIESTTLSRDLGTGGESGPFGVLAAALCGARLVSDALAASLIGPVRVAPEGPASATEGL